MEDSVIILDDKYELADSKATLPSSEQNLCTTSCPFLTDEPLPSTSFDNDRPFFDNYCFDDTPPPPSFPVPNETEELFRHKTPPLLSEPSAVVSTKCVDAAESPMRVDFDVKTISLNSQTPMPNFDAMDEKELNVCGYYLFVNLLEIIFNYV